MPPRGECDFFLGKALDPLPDHLDACGGRLVSLISGNGRGRGGNRPRSSLAFNSNTASLYESPSNCLASARTLVVLPMPGMPEMMTCGMLPSRAMIFSRSIVSVLPTMSSRKTGRYFSTLQAGLASRRLQAGPIAHSPWELVCDAAVRVGEGLVDSRGRFALFFLGSWHCDGDAERKVRGFGW